MSARPSYVPKGFAGKCKCFPKTDAFMLAYQARWIQDDSISKLMEKSRRVGISYATAYERVRKHAQDNWRVDSWISSRDEPTARLVIKDCSGFAKILNCAAQDLGERVIDDKGNTAHVLGFSNNTGINSVASNPDVFAGKGGDVVLDEFALRQRPRDVYAIAGPTIDWGGSLGIISTHRGSDNYFNVLVNEILHGGNPKKFSHHRVTLQDALDQGFLYKLQSKLRPGDPRLDLDEAGYFDYQRSRCADEETFQQEYMCAPANDAAAFIGYELIDSVTELSLKLKSIQEVIDALGTEALPMDSRLYIGLDVARKKDLCVLDCGVKLGDVVWDLCRIEMQNRKFSEIEFNLYRLLELPNVRRACIDSTGLGMQLAERAQDRFGWKIEPINFTAGVKEKLAFPLKSDFEDRKIRLVKSDALTADLRGIKKEISLSGNIRFVGDSEDSHCDRFWALALRQHAARSPKSIGAMVG